MIDRKYFYLAAVIVVVVLLYFFYPGEDNSEPENNTKPMPGQVIHPEIGPMNHNESKTHEEDINTRIIP